MQSITNDYVSKSKIQDLPKKYWEKTYSNFETLNNDLKNKLKICYDYACGKLEKTSLVMTGSVGSGKTHLAVMIAKNMKNIVGAYGERQAFVRFCVADELFVKFNDLFVIGKSKNDFIDELLRNDLLIIDDLGVANFTPAKQENLYLLVNRAYLEEKRILVTTNFTLEQLKKLDERIVSRFLEMGTILKFNHSDFRAK